ncbi:PadR family transcriptional regulator [Deinococcus radiotolerans]|uniref:PadR family transcriptional regulator n=1 Tax=Deinococcus radiotolerans TaxID=1309407 RepID=A0ABQ2FLU3_9DEIO|nr:PadR family transcriptional regulator [Deinococcus radiotolerans]GGL08106.1 PadR family transcriptional regulator [Deinococcus radiotolerans]
MNPDPNTLLLLGLLRGQRQHGYQLHDFIERNLSRFTTLKKAAAYAALDRLEKAGLIHAHSEQAGNRPTRKVYALTPDGEQHFLTLLRAHLAHPEPVAFYGDLSLMFLTQLPRPEALNLLTERAQAVDAQIASLERVPTHHGALGPDLFGVDLAVSRQLTLLRADRAWLSDTLSTLNRPE